MREGKVAVITRTKNRELLLWRAMWSVAGQTYRNLVWVIVNDGGRTEEVEVIANEGRIQGLEVVVIHHPESKGMEAASNAGIRAVDTEYILIHDDDDTLEPTFLEETTSFLKHEPLYAGVITHTLLVKEELDEKQATTRECYGFNTWLRSVYLMEILMVNSFPPISFLFKRTAYNTIGGYDETLPVLGDWDFNIRFLTKYDIGVIPKLLARYHQREGISDAQNNYGNTVVAGQDKHIRYDAILRNRYLRQELDGTGSGIGLLANLAAMNSWQTAKFESVNSGKFLKGMNAITELLLKKSSLVRRLKDKIKSSEAK